jgi:hypothetical protein
MNYLQYLEPQRGNVELFNRVTIFDMRTKLKRQEYPKHKRSLFAELSILQFTVRAEFQRVASIFCLEFTELKGSISRLPKTLYPDRGC